MGHLLLAQERRGDCRRGGLVVRSRLTPAGPLQSVGAPSLSARPWKTRADFLPPWVPVSGLAPF